MVKFKLVPYIIHVKKKHSNEQVSLDNIDEKGMDFLTVLKVCFENTQSAQIIEKQKKTISIEKFNFSGRDVYGIAKSGEYGIEADFVNIETYELIPHAREKKHSETYPFFFNFSLPSGLNRGILILQVFKVFGIKTLLLKTINDYLNEQGLVMELNRLISETLLEQIENSRLIELQLIRFDVPQDTADKVHDGRPEEIYEKRIFHGKYKKEISLNDRLKSLLTNRETNYYEILGVQYDEIKAIIEKNGSKSTLTFGNQDIFREFMPLEGDIPISHGFPKYEYLLEMSEIYKKHLRERLGG